MEIKTNETKDDNGIHKTIEIEGLSNFCLFKFMIIVMAILWSVPFIIHWGWLAAEKYK